MMLRSSLNYEMNMQLIYFKSWVGIFLGWD